MATVSGGLNAELRRRELVELVEHLGAVTMVAAAERLDVSEITIRRDMLALEQEGLIRRVRGGAARLRGPRRFEVRSQQRKHEKALVAQKALSFVPHQGAIALDASTTVGALAATLPEREDLVAVTNSIENFKAMQRAGLAFPMLSGGSFDHATGSLVGPIACGGAAMLGYDVCFMSASGVHPELGLTDVSLDEAQVKREFARASAQVVLLADSSKLGARDLARTLPWESIDVLITELSPGDKRLEQFRDLVELA